MLDVSDFLKPHERLQIEVRSSEEYKYCSGMVPKSPASNATTYPQLRSTMVKHITVKAIAVQNLGVDDLTISPPGGAAPVTLVINQKEQFSTTGSYIVHYGNDQLTAFSFEFSGGNFSITQGRVTSDAIAANVAITATLT
ncbi:hypothetical protein PC9H_005861 [Pleurotus ostreatus]|uniref:Uncharacterized protein n=1 Tax=Pleurotus ostreatus TaxID=5322 RepID=A0A8H6ZSQ2_PLEOS|nr:uncharacterized protein PC9H_005861 [Pleurotus ostreatus]KAF7430161.1 hypothetical protein PC9H_005861 [Pleurotus ostreatus]KAJ8701222.1 hypothetical protein PTI98_000035 [Pleurotus ostreatus]